MLSSLIFIVAFLRSYVAVTVDPTTSAAGISVSLINDPRGLNQVDANNRWTLVESSVSNPLNDWGLRINLDAESYGFKSGASDSSVTVSVDADIETSEADLFVGVGVGDQYVTYAFDLDGALWFRSNVEENLGGVWTFPQCSTGTMASGDVSRLLLAENLDSSIAYPNALRDALCGGDDYNCELLTSTRNNGALPVTLQLTSDDVAKTLQVTFSTPTYASAPFSCTFDVSGGSVVGQDLDIFLNNDGGRGLEIVAITSVDVTASNVGCNPSGVVDPTTTANGISVLLINDTRGLNQVDDNNRWTLENSVSNPLNDWGLRINLDADTYGFKSGASDSSVTVSVDADVSSSEADLFVGVGVGDQYVTYAFDLDGGLWLRSNAAENFGGVWTFPQCSTGTMASGDVSRLLLAENLDSSIAYSNALRDALCGGDGNNCELLTSTRNNGALPVTLQLTSDDIAKTLEITFSTPTYASAPFSCTFDVSGASVVGQDLDIFLNNDGGGSLEIVAIKSVDVTASNVGTCSQPTEDPTANPTGNPTTVRPTTANPTATPTVPPTNAPTTANPTTATANPTTANPTTANPTAAPTVPPTNAPTNAPTTLPTLAPTLHLPWFFIGGDVCEFRRCECADENLLTDALCCKRDEDACETAQKWYTSADISTGADDDGSGDVAKYITVQSMDLLGNFYAPLFESSVFYRFEYVGVVNASSNANTTNDTNTVANDSDVVDTPPMLITPSFGKLVFDDDSSNARITFYIKSVAEADENRNVVFRLTLLNCSSEYSLNALEQCRVVFPDEYLLYVPQVESTATFISWSERSIAPYLGWIIAALAASLLLIAAATCWFWRRTRIQGAAIKEADEHLQQLIEEDELGMAPDLNQDKIGYNPLALAAARKANEAQIVMVEERANVMVEKFQERQQYGQNTGNAVGKVHMVMNEALTGYTAPKLPANQQ